MLLEKEEIGAKFQIKKNKRKRKSKWSGISTSTGYLLFLNESLI